MKRRDLYKLLLVLFLLAWSLSELYPWTAHNLVETFDNESATQDKEFSNIIDRAKKLEVANVEHSPSLTYSNLVVAIGTNDITRYFPSNYINAATERDPVRGVLNRVQRAAAGQFRLGLDLQGGTQFLLEMDMSRAQTNPGVALNAEFTASQAVEVLRRRVDRFGVSEPVIAPAGGNRILVQLPGLSEASKAVAREQIQKAAFLLTNRLAKSMPVTWK